MTIDEAIEHAEWCADNSCGECADEHRQLAEWLEELRRARRKIELLKILRDRFKADAQMYKNENDRLRELARRLLTEYRYMRVRPRRVYLGHEGRMRAIEGEMRELGIEVE